MLDIMTYPESSLEWFGSTKNKKKVHYLYDKNYFTYYKKKGLK